MIEGMKSVFFSSDRRCFLLAYIVMVWMVCTSVGMAQSVPEVRLRVVGGLAAVSQYTLHEERFWARDLAALSGGRYSASIVPFNRAGVPAQEMLNLIRLGVIPLGTVLLSQIASEEPELGAPDLAGLNPDMNTLRRVVGAFRPTLEKTLRDRHGVELLAVYVYPAQVVFCRRPMAQLSDLAGRRIRVSSASQADFVSALNATPVVTEFAELMSNMKSDNTECAITGAMSGNTLGLHKITSALYNMPLSWGLAAFAANKDTWKALPTDLKTLLATELPKLEAAVWAESEQETSNGVACNTGADVCARGTRGAMIEARPTAADDRRRRDIFAKQVLAPWVKRCGASCAQTWEKTVGPATGISIPVHQ